MQPRQALLMSDIGNVYLTRVGTACAGRCGGGLSSSRSSDLANAGLSQMQPCCCENQASRRERPSIQTGPPSPAAHLPATAAVALLTTPDSCLGVALSRPANCHSMDDTKSAASVVGPQHSPAPGADGSPSAVVQKRTAALPPWR